EASRGAMSEGVGNCAARAMRVARDRRIAMRLLMLLSILGCTADRRAVLQRADAQLALSEQEAFLADVMAREFPRGAPAIAELRRSSRQHLAQGLELSQNAVDHGPGDDEGFRVLARAALDAHDWLRFDEAMSEIDSAHSRTPAMLFLLGREQLERCRDALL